MPLIKFIIQFNLAISLLISFEAARLCMLVQFNKIYRKRRFIVVETPVLSDAPGFFGGLGYIISASGFLLYYRIIKILFFKKTGSGPSITQLISLIIKVLWTRIYFILLWLGTGMPPRIAKLLKDRYDAHNSYRSIWTPLELQIADMIKSLHLVYTNDQYQINGKIKEDFTLAYKAGKTAKSFFYASKEQEDHEALVHRALNFCKQRGLAGAVINDIKAGAYLAPGIGRFISPTAAQNLMLHKTYKDPELYGRFDGLSRFLQNFYCKKTLSEALRIRNELTEGLYTNPLMRERVDAYSAFTPRSPVSHKTIVNLFQDASGGGLSINMSHGFPPSLNKTEITDDYEANKLQLKITNDYEAYVAQLKIMPALKVPSRISPSWGGLAKILPDHSIIERGRYNMVISDKLPSWDDFVLNEDSLTARILQNDLSTKNWEFLERTELISRAETPIARIAASRSAMDRYLDVLSEKHGIHSKGIIFRRPELEEVYMEYVDALDDQLQDIIGDGAEGLAALELLVDCKVRVDLEKLITLPEFYESLQF